MPTKPVEEPGVEALLPGGGSLCGHGLDLGFTEAHRLHPLQEPSHAGGDAVTGLVVSVVRVAAKEIVELGIPFGHPLLPVDLGHGQLVLVSPQNSVQQVRCVRHGPNHAIPIAYNS